MMTKIYLQKTVGSMIMGILYIIILPLYGVSQKLTNTLPQNSEDTAKERDGQHDFDFEIGVWKTHLKRLTNPLSGVTAKWVEYEGTTIVKKILNGKANLVELIADGEAGHFDGLNLRLYNPQSQQWSLNFASARGGTLSKPTVGKFKNGIGEFYDQEDFNGKMIFVKFIINPIAKDSIRFEQSFSDDGGKTWELNWVATDARIKD